MYFPLIDDTERPGSCPSRRGINMQPYQHPDPRHTFHDIRLPARAYEYIFNGPFFLISIFSLRLIPICFHIYSLKDGSVAALFGASVRYFICCYRYVERESIPCFANNA